MIYAIDSLDQLKKFVLELCKREFAGKCIVLSGSLGSGKTTFVRELVGCLGGNVEEVSSPTYVLEHKYKTRGVLSEIEHWDLYRIAAVSPELYEPVENNKLRVIEWGEKFHDVLDLCDMRLSFRILADGKREVEVRECKLDGID